jgi:hypothetical protein
MERPTKNPGTTGRALQDKPVQSRNAASQPTQGERRLSIALLLLRGVQDNVIGKLDRLTENLEPTTQ